VGNVLFEPILQCVSRYTATGLVYIFESLPLHCDLRFRRNFLARHACVMNFTAFSEQTTTFYFISSQDELDKKTSIRCGWTTAGEAAWNTLRGGSDGDDDRRQSTYNSRSPADRSASPSERVSGP